MGRIATTIDLHGPFFARDPSKTFRQNIRVMLAAMAREGEEDVRAQIPVRTGFTRSGVIGRVAAISGRPWALNVVISEQHVFPWAAKGQRGFSGRGEAEYRAGRLEAKLHMFRRTASRLRRSRAVNMAELTRGLE